ncbi:MAG: hypothetical protein N2Z21_10915 [Candidatus Sumerlaeaceae bacterium]|nr:hypothetical protein [Candidatus Sumerlaeaceae bacterium]
MTKPAMPVFPKQVPEEADIGVVSSENGDKKSPYHPLLGHQDIRTSSPQLLVILF